MSDSLRSPLSRPSRQPLPGQPLPGQPLPAWAPPTGPLLTTETAAEVGFPRRPDALAPIEIALGGDRHVVVRGLDASTTIGDIAVAAGVATSAVSADCLEVDGVAVAFSSPLIATALREGSRVGSISVPAAPALPAGDVIVEAVWVAGPDAGGRVRLGVGEHCIGRARTAAVNCRDPEMELHHVLLVVRSSGHVRVDQIGGRRAVLLDGQPLVPATAVLPGQRLVVGSSVLELRTADLRPPGDLQQSGSRAHPRSTRAERSHDPWHVPYVRTARATGASACAPITVPPAVSTVSTFAGALLPTLLGVAAAAVIAVVLHQVMFLLFGLMGAVVALATWGVQKAGVARKRARAKVLDSSAMAAFATALRVRRDNAQRAHLESVVSIDDAVDVIVNRTSRLWSVRPADQVAWRVMIGLGDVVTPISITGLDAGTRTEIWNLVDDAQRFSGAPVVATLSAGSVTAVAGAGGVDIVRGLVMQLAAASGPADWCLAIVTDRPEQWRCLAWLPHLRDTDGSRRILAVAAASDLAQTLDEGTDARHLVVVVDSAAALTARTSALRRVLHGDRDVAMIVLCSGEKGIPAVATCAVVTGAAGRGRWIDDTRVSGVAAPVHPAGMSAAAAFDVARQLADLVDPECGDEIDARLGPVSMMELLGPLTVGDDVSLYAHRIAAGWTANGPDPAPIVALGRASDGVVDLDLVRDGPHALIGGTTGSGKSELLRSLVVGLAARQSPRHVTFVLIDYKGGATFDACAGLPHVVGLVTDLDGRLAARASRSLDAELRRREGLLREVGATDLSSYRAMVGVPDLPRLVVVIDEFASLAVQQPEFIGALLGIAQRGRSLGVHLLLATQRPHGVINDDMRANTNMRIALRVQDRGDSVDILGGPAAAALPRTAPGRAIMRLGTDELVTFQAACCTAPIQRHGRRRVVIAPADGSSSLVVHGQQVDAVGTATSESELDVLARAIREAARIAGVVPPHRPWLPPLDEASPTTAQDDSSEAAIGAIDEPDRQCRRALSWTAQDGNLLLVGATGVGLTSTLLAIAATMSRGATAATAATAATPASVAAALPTSASATAAVPTADGGRRQVEFVVLDGMGDARLALLAAATGCAGVVSLHETERVMRLLGALDAEVGRRKATPADRCTWPDIVVLLDGLSAVRARFEQNDDYERLGQLDRIVAEGGAVGVVVVMTATRPGAVPAAMMSHIGVRWVFHLADASDGPLAGVAAAEVPGARPGRLMIAAEGLEAQVCARAVARAAELEELTDLATHRTVPVHEARPAATNERRVGALQGALHSSLQGALRTLPLRVDLGCVPQATASGADWMIPLGLSFETLHPVVLPVAAGEHVLVIGPSRSGRSNAVNALAQQWEQACPRGWSASIAPRRTSARRGHVAADVEALVVALPPTGPALIVIDDAELVDDPSGQLARLIASRREGLLVVAAGRPDALRGAYGHWTAALRRSRLGLVMASCTDLDGDLLGAALPRRPPIPSRAGLAWMVADGGRQLIQVATAAAGPEAREPTDVVDAAFLLDVATSAP